MTDAHGDNTHGGNTHSDITDIVSLLQYLRAESRVNLPIKDKLELLKRISRGRIKFSYEPVVSTDGNRANHAKYRRIILGRYKAGANARTGTRALDSQANGIVLDVNDWRVLSYPAPYVQPCNASVDPRNYDIYEIVDGTCVTMYYDTYQSTWRLSSANGFDVTDLTQYTTCTYWRALLECIGHSVKTAGADINIANNDRGSCADCIDCRAESALGLLDKTKCYTVCFRHRAFHPCGWAAARTPAGDGTNTRELPTVRLIQVCDLAQLNAAEPQLTAHIGAELANEIIPAQMPVTAAPDGKPLTKRDLVLARNDTCALGYILRPRSRNGAGSGLHYIIESAKMQQLRRLVYNIPQEWYARADKLLCIILRNYLHPLHKGVFIKLCPQFAPAYARFDEFFKTLVDKIAYLLRFRRPEVATARAGADSNDTSATACGVVSNTMDKLAQQFWGEIDAQFNINPNAPGSNSIIRDCICDVRYLERFMPALPVNEYALVNMIYGTSADTPTDTPTGTPPRNDKTA